LVLASISLFVVVYVEFYGYHTVNAGSIQNVLGPTINDPELKVELLSSGIKFPTSMAFLGSNDILVLEKNSGKVRRIVNGVMSPEPLLDVNVASKYERGMLGIAISQNTDVNKPKYVFLYYTEAPTKDGDDITEGKNPLGNRLYRYELADNGTKLVNPTLLLDLPARPGPIHNGGKINVGPDNNVYLAIGDVNHMTKAENIQNGGDPNGTGGILRITQDGKPVDKGILGNKYPLNLYYAYGIRNSFGIGFDPVTKTLWDTENGESYGDEINLVDPGFNSGFSILQGKSSLFPLYNGKRFNPDDLVDFDKKGQYSDPEFTWNVPVGVTSIQFLNSSKLGKQYENDMFVSDFHNGNIYHFDLNKNRTSLSLKGPLADKFANETDKLENDNELKQVIFGHGFGSITDIKVGPDGYLYILSLKQGGPSCDPKHPGRKDCIAYDSPIEGTIYRIIPLHESK